MSKIWAGINDTLTKTTSGVSHLFMSTSVAVYLCAVLLLLVSWA
jgi:hypothetical protein